MSEYSATGKTLPYKDGNFSSPTPERKCDKELALRTMMLLSALESWGFSTNHRLPDYILEDIERIQDELKAEVIR